MDKRNVAKQTLERQVKFASRAAILLKNPATNELFKMMMEDMANYNNDITGATPLSHEEYLITLGRLQGLNRFINKLKNAAANKDEYAKQLSKYQ